MQWFVARTYVLIDALDECRPSNDGPHRFLQAISRIRNETKVDSFITSRHILEIVELFEGMPSLEIRARDGDVPKYVEGRMGGLPSFILERTDLQQEIRDQIASAADGMYVIHR